MKPPVFALVDCNNFFVSCERLFRPDLEGRPVVVLSSNDGCAVSRSQEAKALGIPMGAPAFQFRRFFKDNGVAVFSANFELYGDISARITSLLTGIAPYIEVYSVDESFFDLRELNIADYAAWGREIIHLIYRHTGVPVSVGLAGSKTLSKLATRQAKKDSNLHGVLSLVGANSPSLAYYLSRTPLADVWGVGWRLAPRLKAEGLHTALDLAQFSPNRARQLMGMHGQQLVAELNGISCLPLQLHHKPAQQVMRGRQFGEDTNNFGVLEAAVASLTARAAAVLRREGLLACQVAVIIRSNRHRPGYHKLTRSISLIAPTADTGALCACLVQALGSIFNPNETYHKADVLLYDLIPAAALQASLLDKSTPLIATRSQARLEAVDNLNGRYGPGTVYYAAQDLSRSWHPRHNLGSPHYTTSWDELPVIY